MFALLTTRRRQQQRSEEEEEAGEEEEDSEPRKYLSTIFCSDGFGLTKTHFSL